MEWNRGRMVVSGPGQNKFFSARRERDYYYVPIVPDFSSVAFSIWHPIKPQLREGFRIASPDLESSHVRRAMWLLDSFCFLLFLSDRKIPHLRFIYMGTSS